MSKHQFVTIVWLIVCVVLWLCVKIFWVPLAIVTVLYLSLLALGVFKIELNYFLDNINTLPNDAHMVALTFDDGPHPNTLKVLDVLEKHGAKATFFCIGQEVKKYPDILKRICQEGHLIGNHTLTHRYVFPVFGVATMQEELRKTNEAIAEVTGEAPSYFRPPFGVTNPRIAKAVKKTGMLSIGWNRRSLDTVSSSKEEVVKRMTQDIHPGDILLFHDRLEMAADVLDLLLSQTKGQGLVFERLDKIPRK
jgi:peptidoglycan-N-acetylglucosamine deacetylase